MFKLFKLKGKPNSCERNEMEKSLTHLRQCSEWGNHVLVDTFRKLKGKLPTNNRKRAIEQWSSVLLHNFRTETVGRNQVKSYFEWVVANEKNDSSNDI